MEGQGAKAREVWVHVHRAAAGPRSCPHYDRNAPGRQDRSMPRQVAHPFQRQHLQLAVDLLRSVLVQVQPIELLGGTGTH
eukprot:1682012-Pyramimonas_sp.AAC.1